MSSTIVTSLPHRVPPVVNGNIGFNSVAAAATMSFDNEQFKTLNLAGEKLQKALQNVAEQPDALKSAINNYDTANEMEMHKATAALNKSHASGNSSNSTALVEQYGTPVSQLIDELPPNATSFLTTDAASNVKNAISDGDFLDELYKYVGDMKSNYINRYSHAVSKYSEYFKRITKLIALIGDKIKNAEANNSMMEVNWDDIRAEILRIQNDFIFDNNPENALYVSTATGKAGAEEALKWAEEFGIPGNIRRVTNEKGENVYFVVIDQTPLGLMYKSTFDKEGKVNMAEFQAWQAGFDAQKETMQNTVQVLTEKYGRANSSFDSMVKIFSGMLAAHLENIREYNR